MVSTWTDYLHCSILKNGSLSLRLNVKSEFGSEWFPSIKNIRTPEEFISAFGRMERLENWLLSDLLPALHRHHPIFALRLEHMVTKQEIDDEFETEVNVLINVFMNDLKLDLPSGVTNARVFIDKVRGFVRETLERTGEYPRGSHTINGAHIDFPSFEGIE